MDHFWKTLAGFGAVLALAACLMPEKQAENTGPQDFADYCSGCHGATGNGDGEPPPFRCRAKGGFGLTSCPCSLR